MSKLTKILSAFVLVMVLCSSAYAALPSLTMLSTKTCPACAQMSKVLTEIDSKYKSSLTTERVYLEDNPEVAKEYNVRYVPMLIFRDADGKEIAREIGYKPLDEVVEIFRKSGVKI